MERIIGETFEFEGHKLKVVDKDSYGCDGCFCLNRECSLIKDVIGFCSDEYRTDKKRVIFVEAKDEQPQELNLCEILKNCPKGFKLYSVVYGEVTFLSIKDGIYPICVLINNNGTEYFSSSGKLCESCGECLLFPSKEQRDWSKFTAPWYKRGESIKPKFKVGDRIRHKETNKDDVYEISKVYDDSYGIVGFNWGIYMKYQDQYELAPNKFDPKTLKPFDKVLSRYDGGYWSANLFSHIDERDNEYCAPFSVCNGSLVKFCIPYNDGTKHLVGTEEEAPDFYRYWED